MTFIDAAAAPMTAHTEFARQRHGQDTAPDQSFAAIIDAKRPTRNRLAPPAHTPVLRFDEAGVFGHAYARLATSEISTAPCVEEPQALATAFSKPEDATSPSQALSPDRLGAQKQTNWPIDGRGLARHAVRQASPLRSLPGAARGNNIVAPEPQLTHQAAPARAQRMRPSPRSSLFSPVLVALHAAESEVFVFARAGRMAPGERERLRSAISALLLEHGHAGARVRLQECMEAAHG